MRSKVDELLRNEDSYESSSGLAFLVYDDVEAADWESLTDVEEAAPLVHIFASDVSNGGFEQFFAWEDGNRAEETLRVLEGLAAQRAVEMLVETMHAFPNGLPSSNHDRRLNQMELLDDAVRVRQSDLSDEFWD